MTERGPELDIRWPIGLLFAAIGIAVGIYGIFSGARSTLWAHEVNINLWWGVVMLAFGLAMIWGAVRAGRRTRN
ncbi:MAG: hypothetical protein WBE20_11230 [Candidatus Acidiferrales bacterium]